MYKKHSILSNILLATAVLSVHFEQPVILTITISGLIAGAVLLRFPYVISLGVITILLYPLQNWGWIYGRDSHFVIYYAIRILKEGWPLTSYPVRGFAQTPFIHLFLGVGNLVTGLPLSPEVESTVMISSLTPIIFLGISFLIILISARHYRSILSLQHNLIIPVVLVALLWVPAIRFRSGIRRGSIAMILFLLGVYALYRYLNSGDRRYMVLMILIAILLPTSHHFTAFQFCLFTAVVLVTSRIHSWVFHSRQEKNISVSLMLLPSIFFCIWFFIGEYGADMFALQLVGALIGLLSISSSAPPSDLNISTINIIRANIKLVYVGLLAAAFTIALFVRFRTRSLSKWDLSIYTYSIFLGGIATGAVIGVSPIGTQRILTFFVFTGGVYGITVFLSNLSPQFRKNTTSMVIGLILILSALSAGMVYPSEVGLGGPTSASVTTSQHYESADYAAAEYVNEYRLESQNIFTGDFDIKEVVESQIGTRVYGSQSVIQSREVPENSMILLRERNKRMLWSGEKSQWISGDSDIISDYDTNSNRIYHNGGRIAWV